MPKIILKDVTKRWGGFYAVEHLNLEIEDNAFVTLLGPSGCGKTTTLRMIAGLETPTSGRIEIGDRVVFDSELGINVPANKRKVGFLFQNYALWPNMTVYQNISFGLSNVNEEMPKVNFNAKVDSQIVKILKEPKKLVEAIELCRDKKNNIDAKKVYLRLIDTYIISMMTAKKIYSFNLHTLPEEELQNKANDLLQKYANDLKNEIQKAKSSGYELNENFEYVKDGKIVIKKRKLEKEEIDLTVRRVSRIVKIGMFMDRYPAELSGGQQQRVAIARTLAPEPSVLFMDEPLSNLDAKLRLEMRSELQRLHLDTGSTFVYVTHDQMEAMTLATKICLIENGVLQQYDAPLTVYSKPNNTFVADFVGNPSINFIETTKQNDNDFVLYNKYQYKYFPSEELSFDEWVKKDNEKTEEIIRAKQELMLDKKNVEKANKDTLFKYHIAKVEETEIEDEIEITDNDFVFGIRPESVKIDNESALRGTIYSAMPTGMETTVKIQIDNFLITGVIFGGITYKIGEEIGVSFADEGIMLFSRKTGRFVCNGKLEAL